MKKRRSSIIVLLIITTMNSRNTNAIPLDKLEKKKVGSSLNGEFWEIEKAFINLEQAIQNLEKIDKADKVLLRLLIIQVKSLDTSRYTEESWQVVEQSLYLAEITLNDTEATQAEVDGKRINLQLAIEQLEEVS